MNESVGIPIVCSGPGPHDPADGVVGYWDGYAPKNAEPLTNGTRCAAPECQPPPTPELLDADTRLNNLLAAIASAKSLTDLQTRISEDNP